MSNNFLAVESLKIKKGTLALYGDYCEDDDTCCYSTGILEATIKAGKKTSRPTPDPFRQGKTPSPLPLKGESGMIWLLVGIAWHL